jgi:hypothetical protein
MIVIAYYYFGFMKNANKCSKEHLLKNVVFNLFFLNMRYLIILKFKICHFQCKVYNFTTPSVLFYKLIFKLVDIYNVSFLNKPIINTTMYIIYVNSRLTFFCQVV